MADPYTPALSEFSLDADEDAVILLATASDKPWDYVPKTNDEKLALKSAKNKMLAFHLDRHGWNCCYCRTDLHAAGPYMTDREHILPKGITAYKPYSYAIWNLTAACKRCNMQFKGTGDEFVIDRVDVSKYQTSENYRFVHPNFDCWEDHLTRLSVQVNAQKIIVIICKPNSDKAVYTHAFFNLHDFEVDSFDSAQGLVNNDTASAAVLELRKLVKTFGQ